jgi:hypothetical protein
MPVILVLLHDSQQMVEYKIRLVRLSAEFQAELDDLKKWRAYYAGNHDLLLSEDQKAFLENVIDDDSDWPIDNRCQKVVDKVKGRLNVIGFVDPAGNKITFDEIEEGGGALGAAALWWANNDMDHWEGELYRYALRDGEAFIIVDHNGKRPRFTVGECWDGDSGIRMIYEDPKTKQRPVAAIKYWYTTDPVRVEASGVLRATLYTASAVYKYARFANERQARYYDLVDKKTEDDFYRIRDPADGGQWPVAWTNKQGEPLGLAVVPFVSPRGSLVGPIVGLNNALNKTNLDLLANADQQGFGIPVIEYEQELPIPYDNTSDTDANDPAGGDGFGFRPGRVIETTGKMHKLPADDLRGLLDLANFWQVAIASNSDIPMYEFTPVEGNVPSGAALEIIDASLSEHAAECQIWFTSGYRTVMTRAQGLERAFGSLGGEPVVLTPLWSDPRRRTVESRQQETNLQMQQLALEREQALGMRTGVGE